MLVEASKPLLKSKVVMSRGERARRFLEDKVWPRLQGQVAPSKTEIETLLGYGPAGV